MKSKISIFLTISLALILTSCLSGVKENKATSLTTDVVLCQDETNTGTGTGTGLDFGTILNVVLSVTSVVFAGLLAKTKGKFQQAIQLGKELMEAGDAIDEGLKDNNLTPTERNRIKAEWQDVKEAWKKLINFKSS